MAMIAKVLRMHHREKSVRETARATILSRNTVCKYLRIGHAEAPRYRLPPVPMKLTPFVEAVSPRVKFDRQGGSKVVQL